MSSEPTRRDFLKASGWGVVSVAASVAGAQSLLTGDHAGASVAANDIAVWLTDENQRLASGPSIAWQSVHGAASHDAVILTPEEIFQEILGFGAAFTDAACYVLNQLPPAAREKLFHELLHPSEMGLNVCRTCIGSSDYATKMYSYDEGDPDPDLKRFSIEHDREYILPLLREARKANPELFLFSSPWSPPGWMKANGSMLGGSMRRQYMPSYAHYFLRFLQSYEADGVPVQAVTVQNEVDTDQDGRMPACIWPQEYEADFVSSHLGPLLEQNGVKTQIWLIDHNYNLWGRAAAELESPDVRKYANAVAWHGYQGEPEWIGRVQRLYPDVEMHWTEGGPDFTDPNYATDWTHWSETFAIVLQNWCRSITVWNLALDERGQPNIGPFTCAGLITVDSQSKDISYSGQYWALAHYSRFIRRGARRFQTQSRARDLYHCGFENPDGQCVVVLTNAGAPRACQIQLGRKAANIRLTGNSVTTLLWSKS